MSFYGFLYISSVIGFHGVTNFWMHSRRWEQLPTHMEYIGMVWGIDSFAFAWVAFWECEGDA